MRAILVLLVVLLSSNFAMAENRTFSTITPLAPSYYNTYGQQNYAQPVTSYDDLSQMELSVFNRTYRDVLVNRVARLERRIFGSVQDGDINQRYLSLQNAVNQYNLSKYQNPQQDFYNTQQPVQSGWKGVLSNLGGMIIGNSMGYPTGYTPQIDPFSVINNSNNGIGTLGGYGSSGGYNVNRGIFGNGYSNSNYGMGAGSGVHIMY